MAFAFKPGALTARLHGLRGLRRERPADFWHLPLFASFWLFIALFPIGYGWREVMPPVCFIFLILYYRHAWPESVLKRLSVSWLFIPAALMLIGGVAFSGNVWASLLHSGTGLNKAFILPFIAMECARDGRCLRRLAWALAFACFWQGIDGLWQAARGRDFIMGYQPNNGRLTGSMGDYVVGNYIALALVPAFAVWPCLRHALGKLNAAFIFMAIFWPAFFLLQGASGRSGVLALAGALGLWAMLRFGARNWRVLALPAAVLAAFMVFQPSRITPASVVQDNRWDLWRLGWRVFLEHPWLGAGSGQYNEAFRALGLSPSHEVITISHPHNLYLDMLYAHGIIGFGLGMLFLLGFLLWGWRAISAGLSRELASRSAAPYWAMAVWFWLGYAAWLINGIFGHDFYRTWWLAEAMCSLGIMIGAVVNAPGNEPGAALSGEGAS